MLPGRPRNPQLPLYGLAHAERLRALAYVIAGARRRRVSRLERWRRRRRRSVRPYPAGVKIDLGDPGDWQALLHYWRFTLTRLAERYVAGDARVDPLPFECTTCHLSTFCRINELALSEPEPE